jgi:hypothetical protein
VSICYALMHEDGSLDWTGRAVYRWVGWGIVEESLKERSLKVRRGEGEEFDFLADACMWIYYSTVKS